VFRTLLEWLAVAVLGAIVATVPATSKAIKERAPVKVESVQPGSLDDLREGVINLYERIAKGGHIPGKADK
jgi:hypothetical protein